MPYVNLRVWAKALFGDHRENTLFAKLLGPCSCLVEVVTSLHYMIMPATFCLDPEMTAEKLSTAPC